VNKVEYINTKTLLKYKCELSQSETFSLPLQGEPKKYPQHKITIGYPRNARICLY